MFFSNMQDELIEKKAFSVDARCFRTLSTWDRPTLIFKSAGGNANRLQTRNRLGSCELRKRRYFYRRENDEGMKHRP